MFKNYFIIAIRNLKKNKLYSSVNIIGLTIGITACILIGLYVWNELSYDRFHRNGDRIARVTMEYSAAGTLNKVAVTGTKVGPALKRTFPQVAAYTRTMKSARVVANGTNAFDEKNVLYADADFFSMFSFKMLHGNPTTALDAPNKIVLTESVAKKYFGNDNPLGKTVRINDVSDYEITGVAADVPLNSQIQFDMVVSFTSLGVSKTEEWWTANYITYILLQQPGQLAGLQQQVREYMKKVSKEELKTSNSDYLTYNLEPLKKVHLYSSMDGLEPNGNITYIYVLTIIAALILLIACVNYTNLATAQSAGRSTEIGIRKVLGAQQQQLFRQFIGESVMITFVAMVLAIIAAIALLPLFNELTGKTFTASMFVRPVPLLMLVVLGILVSLLAGAYPSFILSNAGLVNILKSGFRVSSSGGGLRKSLIIFQFVISVFLIISTIVVLQQVSYIQHKELGYDREHVLVLPVDYKMSAIYDPLKRTIALNPGVISVSGAYEDPTFIEWGDGITADNGKEKKNLSVTAIPVDLDFIKTMGMKIIAGTDFTPADFLLQDTSNRGENYRSVFILNEKAVRELGWTPEQAIGKTIERGSPGTIKGVIKDFHFASLHTPIGPLVMFLDSSLVRQLFVKIDGKNIPGTIQAIERVWKERVAYRPFSYHFLDEDFNRLYKTEQQTAELFALFVGTAIALACLGLFALAAFTTVQRTKEIGIRKILGANVASIIALVSKDFLRLVLIAIVIASPLAWLTGSRWLQQFAYRINFSWWVFAVAGMIAIAIALATVSFQAIRAAVANPVKSLRSE